MRTAEPTGQRGEIGRSVPDRGTVPRDRTDSPTAARELASVISSVAVSRRQVLAALAASPWLGRIAPASRVPGTDPKTVAAVVTVYRPNSHADVLISRILNGWRNDGGPGPNLRLGSLHIDQPEPSDLGRELAARHGVPLVETIEEAITLGTDEVAVDGVLCIGEHGDYPINAKGQQLYPRRRFLEESAETFRKFGRVVPVFSDKHLGPTWDDASAMFELARSRSIPFMAGSSLPVSYRKPDVSIPIGSTLDSAVVVGYGPLDAYGFHALEALQAFTERRKGGEVGVRRVQCLGGEEIGRAIDGGSVPANLFEAALRAIPTRPGADWRTVSGPDAALFRIEYTDGFAASVVMLPGVALGFGVSMRRTGEADPIATEIELRTDPHFPHFAFLLHAVEQMIHTGTPSYPVERTLLTSGMLDGLLTSRSEGGRPIETPELAIRYRPVDYPHAPGPRFPGMEGLG